MLNANYVMINEQKKSKWIRAELRNSLTYILWKKTSIQLEKIKIEIFENNVQISSLTFHSCSLV